MALCVCASVAASAVKLSKSVPSGWGEDFIAARKAAAAGDKYILLAFSGSDWCGWCVKMDREVYSDKKFVREAKKDFELVMIDSPANQEILSPLAKKQNPSLVEKYGIRGFPSSILVHPDGTVAKRFGGYQRGGPEAFLEKLKAAAKDAGTPKKPAAAEEKK
jgi:protein disulfide-isomerase